jgi:hypothetical protein
MKRLAIAAFIVLASAGLASATSFTVHSYTVTPYTGTENGLHIDAAPVLGPDYAFDLSTLNQTTGWLDLFTVGTDETWVNGDDLDPQAISVLFDFTAPPPAFGGSLTGETWGTTIFIGGWGNVGWDNPLYLDFGTTGRLQVDLENTTFGVPGSANVGVNFTLTQLDTPAQVPEPGSMLLLGSGLIGLALVVRRSSTKRV